MELTRESFAGWLPMRIGVQNGAAITEWCFGNGTALSEPFFELDVTRLMQRPFNLVFRRITPLDGMEVFENALDEVRPAGFIFHMSRCGSTLLARMLRAMPGNLVYSEPGMLEHLHALFGANPQLAPELQAGWERRALAALAHYGAGSAQRLFIKFDSLSIVQARRLAALWPEVPRLFIYRDPVEVLVSHQRAPMSQTFPGVINPALLGMTLEEVVATPRDEYTARVVAMYCETACALAEEGLLTLVSYPELVAAPEAVVTRHLGLPLADEERRRLAEAGAVDAKHPGTRFKPDGADKRREAGADLLRAAERYLYPLHQRLEALHAAQSSGRDASPA